ncbi:MAG: cytochrome b [Xanthomonadales bacterium]|nr:cytochrome b [Xanthomonadales bacterium]
MNHRSPRERWGAVARFLHWAMAVLILGQLALGWFAGELDSSPEKIQWMTGHKSLGITILALAVLRVAWRLLHGRPTEPPGIPAWSVWASRASHAALYGLMLYLPLTGWLTASTARLPWDLWWWFEWPRLAAPDPALHEVAEDLHEIGVWLLVAVLLVHVAAGLWHHFVRQDRVLARMWSDS